MLDSTAVLDALEVLLERLAVVEHDQGTAPVVTRPAGRYSKLPLRSAPLNPRRTS